MLTLLALAGLYAGYRVVRAACDSLGYLPRRNEDMVLF